MDVVVFVILAGLTLTGALLTILWTNPLRSALSLLVALVGLAGLYVTLLAHFLAAMQLLVYAGAVMVLFVFVIMLFDTTEQEDRPLEIRPIGVVGGLATLMVVGKFTKVVSSVRPGIDTTGEPFGENFGSIEAVADVLFGQFMLPFELLSLLLLVAVVGAVVVARQRFWRESK